MLNVHLRISNSATGRPTPVRVRISSPDGTQFPPLGRAAEFPSGRAEDVGGHVKLGRERWWYIDGACEIPLPAGVPLRVQASKGPEYTPLDESVTLGAGQLSLRFTISRWTDARTHGWTSIDTRSHFIGPHAGLLEAQAEGIDVVNLLAVPHPVLALDANTYATVPNLLAFSGQQAALASPGTAGVSPALGVAAGETPAVPATTVVVNTLNSHPVLGKVALLNSHRPVFPLVFGGEHTDDWGVCDWCDQCHRKKGLVVWVDAFEPAAGVTGGEALIAAILGKIDAVEVTDAPRKVPLLPWIYRLWDAGVLLPLVGASGKDSNRSRLGCVRTYARTEAASWVEAVRTGHTFATAGPLLTFTREGDRFRASAREQGEPVPVEIVANSRVAATGVGEIEAAFAEPGWVAARCPAQGSFAHTSPVRVGTPVRNPDAVASLLKLIEQIREWVETQGRFENPRRKQALLDRCVEAGRTLDSPP